MMEEEQEVSELDYFSNLNSSDKALRLSAVKGILKRIRYESKHNHHNLYLICKRLIRGLGGSKETFRQGCFACVVGFMSLLPPDFSISVLEEIIGSELHPARNNSKQEKGEAYLGQILAYGSMIITNLIFTESEEVQETIFEKLFQLGRKRSYLHHVSFLFMAEFLKKAEREFVPDGFIDDLRDLNNNPLDKLSYLLSLDSKSIKTSTIKKVLETKSFFDLDNVTKITGFLKKSKTSVMLEHNFITEFTNIICAHPDFFLSFCSSLIDQKHIKSKTETTMEIIKSSSSDDAVILHLYHNLLKACIENGDWELTKNIWHQNLIFLLLQNVKKNVNLVQKFLTDFCLAIKPASDEVKLNILEHTLFELGVLNFDALTKSKTILTLTNSLSFNGLAKLASSYKAVMENKNEIVNFDLKNNGILICLNYYTKLINSPACYEEIHWRLSQLIYLLKLGFFKQRDIYLNRDLINHVQEAFLTSLGHRFSNLDSFQKVLNGLYLELNSLFNKCKDDIYIKFTTEMYDAWKKSFLLHEEMENSLQSESKEVIIVLKIILQYMSILILKEPSTAIINIQDLNNIFLEIRDGCKTMWIEVLTDLFLNLLSKPNYHHRHLIRCIFKSLCPHLSPESFNQIVEVLELSYDPRNIMENNEVYKSDESESDDNDSDKSSDHSETEDMEEDEITANEKLRFELQNVLGAESDVESIDLDNIDEDEGKRLNETLGNVFKSNMKRKRANHISKYQNQLTHFRTRVIDLIEICTEVVLPFSYWLRAAMPLIELFGSTIGQKQLDSLRSRIKSCIKKLNSSKVTLQNNDAEQTVRVLEELFKMLSKSTGVYCDMKMELSCMIRFILKSSKPFSNGLKQKHLNKNKIFKLFQSHLEDFFHGKNNIPVNLFNSVISIGWDGILALIPNLINLIFDENLKVHKRILSIKMFETFTKTPQFFDGHLESYYDVYVTGSKQLFYDLFLNAVEKMCKDPDINMKFYSELWSLLLKIFNKQTYNNKYPEIINQEKVKDILALKFQELPTVKGKSKQNFKKLCNFLNINVTTMKETNTPKRNNQEGTGKKDLNKRKKGDKLCEGIKKKAKRLKTSNVEIVKQTE